MVATPSDGYRYQVFLIGPSVPCMATARLGDSSAPAPAASLKQRAQSVSQVLEANMQPPARRLGQACAGAALSGQGPHVPFVSCTFVLQQRTGPAGASPEPPPILPL
jgi:hypothetical protein